jgi:hypothetical protein
VRVHQQQTTSAARWGSPRPKGEGGQFRHGPTLKVSRQNLMLPIMLAMFVVRSLIVGAMVEEAR